MRIQTAILGIGFLFFGGEVSLPSAPALLTLQDCYELALERSETVAIQKEEIKEAEAQFFKAAGEALGGVDFVLDYSRQESQRDSDSSSVAKSLTDPARRERKFVVNQPLFQGFKALGALLGAGSLRRGEKEEWRRAEQLLFLDVAQAFYGWLRAKKELETVEGIRALLEERIEELEAREEIGRTRPSEVVTAKARLEALEAERARARGAFALAKHLLEFLTGISLEGKELAEEELPQEDAGSISARLESVTRRPDVEAAREAVKTAWQNVVIAQSEFWPSVSLEHNRYLRREGTQSEIDWDLLFKIEVPLFQGGDALGKVKEAVSRWKRERLRYSQVRREAALEIKERCEHWLTSLEETRALERALQASQENFRLQKEEYGRNLVNNLEVLEALEMLFQTRREAVRADYQMKENYWHLQVASGTTEAVFARSPAVILSPLPAGRQAKGRRI